MRSLAFVLVVAGAAVAQQPLSMTARQADGGKLKVQLSDGAAWGSTRWLYIRTGQSQENMDNAPAADAAGVIELTAAQPGAATIGLDLKPQVQEMEAAKLREFAAARCDERLPDAVTGKVKVRWARSCKTLTRRGDGPSNPVFAETGQHADIVPLMDPTRAAVGSDIAFNIAIDGGDLEETRVLAGPVGGKVQDLRVEEGHGHFRVTAPGAWRVEFHHLERAAPGSGADWEITSATLTFEVPEVKP